MTNLVTVVNMLRNIGTVMQSELLFVKAFICQKLLFAFHFPHHHGWIHPDAYVEANPNCRRAKLFCLFLNARKFVCHIMDKMIIS